MTQALIAVAVHDGFYGCGTGAGRSNRAFLTIMADLLDPGVRVLVLPVQLIPESSEYNPAWHQQTRVILRRASIVPVSNGTAGQTRFGGLPSFRTASASAGSIISGQVIDPARTLIVAFDVPFFGLAQALPPRYQPCLVNVARATAALQAPRDSARIAWERDGLATTAAQDGHIAATSRYIASHLTAVYQIPQTAITELTNGLIHDERQPAQPAHLSLTPLAIEDRFLLAFGRAEPYKGFDDLLDALAILRSRPIQVPHTLLAAVTDGGAPTAYQQHLARRISIEQIDITLHTTFSPGIRGLLGHPSLAGVIVPSRTEPFGRIPLEAYAAGASPVIATRAGGLAETVTEPRTGYTVNPADPRSLAEAIQRALTARPAEHARMLTEGRKLIATRYDYETSITAFLNRHAPWARPRAQSA